MLYSKLHLEILGQDVNPSRIYVMSSTDFLNFFLTLTLSQPWQETVTFKAKPIKVSEDFFFLSFFAGKFDGEVEQN